MGLRSGLKVDAWAQPDAGALALQWLEGERFAKLLINDDLRLLWANSTPLKWLEIRDCISLVGEQLIVGRSQFAIRRLVNCASQPQGGICIPVQGSAAHLIVCAKRVSSMCEEPVYGITAHRTDHISHSELFGVREIFRLTACEFAVLKLMVAGLTAQDVAREQGTSIETIRTHIRRLYVKLDVNSREGLFTRLRPFLLDV
jgi:DNA-binding CsgD family transcriptional regulator